MVEFAPHDNDVHAGVAAVLPLECSRRQLRELFENVLGRYSFGGLYDRLEVFIENAIHSRKRAAAATSPPIENPAELALLSALAVLRVEEAEPLLGYPYEHDPKKAHLEAPLQRNPGFSQVSRDIREYYRNTLRGYLNAGMHLPVLAQATAVLLTMQGRKNPDLPDEPFRAYADISLPYVKDFARNAVDRDDEDVRIPDQYATLRCRVDPETAGSTTQLPSLRRADGALYVPRAVVREKLATYAGHGFDRLVHVAFHAVKPHIVERLKRGTPAVDDRLKKKYETGHLDDVYSALYTTPADHPNATGRNPPSVPDRRLVGLVDTIRASDALEFGAFYQASTLAAAARDYFPPPHRLALSELSTRVISGTLRYTARNRGVATGRFSETDDLGVTDVVRVCDHGSGPDKYAIRDTSILPPLLCAERWLHASVGRLQGHPRAAGDQVASRRNHGRPDAYLPSSVNAS